MNASQPVDCEKMSKNLLNIIEASTSPTVASYLTSNGTQLNHALMNLIDTNLTMLNFIDKYVHAILLQVTRPNIG